MFFARELVVLSISPNCADLRKELTPTRLPTRPNKMIGSPDMGQHVSICVLLPIVCHNPCSCFDKRYDTEPRGVPEREQ